MNARARLLVFALGALLLGGAYMAALSQLAPLGRGASAYADILNRVCVRERHITDVVTAVNFDYRGFDTLGEEFIMFTAVMGAVLLLRRGKDEVQAPQEDELTSRRGRRRSDAVALAGVVFTAVLLLFGSYVITHGQLTPGGGFQGGVIASTALWLVYLSGSYKVMRQVGPKPLVEAAEALGAAGYALVGLIGLFQGAAFLQNTLPPGSIGSPFSGGTVPLIDIAVGLEVSGGFVLLLLTFMEEVLEIRLH